MIRAIYIICEGQSEEEFVNGILRPYFNSQQIYDVRSILMTTSKGHKGGDVKYDRLKFNIDKLLNRETDILVTTFIDFFRLKNDFPKFEDAQAIQNKIQRVQFLEQALAVAIDNPRFIPYIQLHEFEGLLFASKEDRKSTRLNSSHVRISYAVFCLKKKTGARRRPRPGRARRQLGRAHV